MTDLSSVARETAEARAVDLYPMVDHELHAMNRSRRLRQKAYVKGFTECASRLPSEGELAEAMFTAYADGTGKPWAE